MGLYYWMCNNKLKIEIKTLIRTLLHMNHSELNIYVTALYLLLFFWHGMIPIYQFHNIQITFFFLMFYIYSV